LGLIDQVVAEPEGGAHEDPLTAAHYLQLAVAKELDKLGKLSTKKLMDRRHKKFRRMGELTPYAKEALNREVEQLEHMVAREHAGRGARHSTRRTTEEDQAAD
jgi:acetyl-CoA carboxylase carboxyl transferase subunit alpha